jgi:TetR/AcrR family fatty acid metabolism transcriptional regulator
MKARGDGARRDVGNLQLVESVREKRGMSKGVAKRKVTVAGSKRRVNRLPAEQRIDDILSAARDVFTEKGYQDALMSDIAERAGLVEGSLYRFFANKRDLLIRTVEHWYEDMLVHDEAQFGGVHGAWNRVRFIVYHHLATIRSEPALSRLVFEELRPDPGYRKTRLFQLNQAYTQRIVDVVKAAMSAGEFNNDVSPSLVRDMIYGAVEHRTWAFLRGEGDFDIESTADGIAELICRGLAKSPAKTGFANGPEKDRVAQSALRLEIAVARLEARLDKA